MRDLPEPIIGASYWIEKDIGFNKVTVLSSFYDPKTLRSFYTIKMEQGFCDEEPAFHTISYRLLEYSWKRKYLGIYTIEREV